MSIERCKKHQRNFDTDFYYECPDCEEEQANMDSEDNWREALRTAEMQVARLKKVNENLRRALEDLADTLRVVNDKNQTSAVWGPRIEAAYRNARVALKDALTCNDFA